MNGNDFLRSRLDQMKSEYAEMQSNFKHMADTEMGTSCFEINVINSAARMLEKKTEIAQLERDLLMMGGAHR